MPPGKLFEHEAMCPYREPSQQSSVPRNAAAMGAITHPSKRTKPVDNNWRAKHQEFITAIKLGKQMAALQKLEQQPFAQQQSKYGQPNGRQRAVPMGKPTTMGQQSIALQK